MTAQLTLIEDTDATWKIPESTRLIGRKGLAEARAVLHSIPRRPLDDDSTVGRGQHPAAA